MALSTAMREAYARVGTGTLHCLAVSLYHSTWPSTLRFVNYDANITINANIYVGHGMEVTEPEITSDPSATMQITFDGVSGTLNPLISVANETDEPVAVTVIPFALNTSDDSVIGTAGSHAMEVMGATLNATTVVLECGFVSPANMAFPSERYTPANRPSLYAG